MRVIPVICYDRTVGYYAPVTQTNPGIREQIRQRKRFNISNMNKDKLERIEKQ